MPLRIPPGFQPQASYPGISLYKKSYRGGQPDYVTVIDLNLAGVRSVSGPSSGSPAGSARVGRLSVVASPTWWDQASRAVLGAHILINGAFFETNASPTRITFGLRERRRTISYGYGLNEYPGKTHMLVFDQAETSCDLIPWNGTEFGRRDTLIGVLDPSVNKSASLYVARTCIGVADPVVNRGYTKVLFYSTAYAKQADGITVLRNFGAERTALLDSGGSTGLVVDRQVIIRPVRSVPHILVAYSRGV
jgi:hypothetical protein